MGVRCGVRCSVPRTWPLREDVHLTFGCDFRPIGGPFRTLTLEYASNELSRWVCEDLE